MSTQTKQEFTLEWARGLIEQARESPRRRYVRFVIEPCPADSTNEDRLWVLTIPTGVHAADDIHIAAGSVLHPNGRACRSRKISAQESLARLVAVAPSCGWTVESHTATEAVLWKEES